MVPLFEDLKPKECNIITETLTNKSGEKTMWLQGVFMEGDVRNRNGRTYPLDQISKAVESANKKIQETNGIFGELDHPQTLTINLDRISHVITELTLVGSNAIGKAKMIATPMGDIGKTLFESGVLVGISSRGAGQILNDVVNEYAFVTADLVATPSAPNALPSSIYESLDTNKHGKEILSLSQYLREDDSAQSFFKREIAKFLSDMDWKKSK